VITPQIADPSSRHRGSPIDTRPQISDSNIPTGLTVSRKVTSRNSVEYSTDADITTATKNTTRNIQVSLQDEHVLIVSQVLIKWYNS
jgi:hypothetical protein